MSRAHDFDLEHTLDAHSPGDWLVARLVTVEQFAGKKK